MLKVSFPFDPKRNIYVFFGIGREADRQICSSGSPAAAEQHLLRSVLLNLGKRKI